MVCGLALHLSLHELMSDRFEHLGGWGPGTLSVCVGPSLCRHHMLALSSGGGWVEYFGGRSTLSGLVGGVLFCRLESIASTLIPS